MPAPRTDRPPDAGGSARGSSRGSKRVKMAWAGRTAAATLGRSVKTGGSFLKSNLWAWPVLGVAVLFAGGWAVRGAIESTMRENLRSQLQTLLNVEVAMLQTWFRVQESTVSGAANAADVRRLAATLAAAEPDAEGVADGRRELARKMAPVLSSHGYEGFLLVGRDRRVLAASDAALLGRSDVAAFEGFLGPALDGRATVSAPFRSVAPLDRGDGPARTGRPTMFAAAPVRDEDFQVVAALCVRIRPGDGFTDILQLGRLGESGETYAFDRTARMVSNSRFDADLMLLGLIPQEGDATSLLTVHVRDPGGDMTEGFRPDRLRAGMPPTRMVAAALEDGEGYSVDPYNDYRGRPVIGAWRWLPAYGLGVATEIDHEEAYRPLTILRRTFFTLYGLLALAAVGLFAFGVAVSRLRRAARLAAVEAKQVGQYELVEELGRGAMGVVYKGRHALMRRPTAVKMLNVEKMTDASVARFEREVQLSCRLENPHTIAIYDYGRTPEGVFYYAMELLEGLDLEELVNRFEPLPPGRAVRLLEQMCGSLFEAHELGLVHRDVKPANVMLARRGGVPDVAKVLDFGLVKAVHEEAQAGLTAENMLAGTPLYVSPEAVKSPNLVDARSDIYAVGAVGYFLLTGRPPFLADGLVQLLQKHVMEPPVPPRRLAPAASEQLEAALLKCLEKSPARRPQTARDLAGLLRRCPEADAWTVEDGDRWWDAYARGDVPAAAAAATPAPAASGGSPASSKPAADAAPPADLAGTLVENR